MLHDACAVLDGRDEKLLQWITDCGIAAISPTTTRSRRYPATPHGRRALPDLPLHEHCLFKLGVHLGELWYLRDLAAGCARTSRSRFLLTAPPLRLPGAVGSPATPVATV